MICALAMLGVRSFAQARQAPVAEQVLTKQDATAAMRMMLTMQANRPFGKAGYGTLAEILPLVPFVFDQATQVDDQTATYRGYTIRMTRSADRKRFELAMLPNGGACGTSWFSNEQNVIYAGLALGCPTQ
jgi:hypothetical protein